MYSRQLSLHEIAKRTGLARNHDSQVGSELTWRPSCRSHQRAIFNKLSPFHATAGAGAKADLLRPKQTAAQCRCWRKPKPKVMTVATASSPVYPCLARGQGKASQAFAPLTFILGEAFQFDWSEEGLLVGGRHFTGGQVAHLKLCQQSVLACGVSEPGP